jgi:hypothetical protein
VNENRHQPPKTDVHQSTYKVAVIAMVLTGCVTVLILGLAIVFGLWIDKLLGVARHYFTLGLVILSVPITIAAIFWVARFTARRFGAQPQNAQAEKIQEDA